MPAAPVSPELVLVDPELARREREALARLAERTAARLHKVSTPEPKPAPPRRRSTSRGRRLRIAVVGVTLCGLALVGSRFAADGSGHSSARAVPPVLSDRAQSVQRAIVAHIAWRPIVGTKRYDVVLWRRGHRVTDFWPTRPSLQIASTSRLAPGAYQWFVFPNFGSRARPRYGPLVTHGMFVIPGA
jgi:hypothetical protein